MPELSGPALPLREALEEKVDEKYTLSPKMWEGHINRTERNLNRGAGFTAFQADLDQPSHTLVARYYKDGKECLVPQPHHPDKRPRMLTERECARLQGFPDEFIPHPTRTAAYKQFGNAAPAPLISHVAESLVTLL